MHTPALVEATMRNDYDGDSLPDTFVANDKLFNSLFHNRKTADPFVPVFDEVAFETGVALPEHGNLISGMGVDFRDLNNDGQPDLAIVALDNETFPVYQNNGKGGLPKSPPRAVGPC